jgi:hypothetical protein
VFIDQEDGRDPDLLVVAKIRRNGLCLLTTNPGPQDALGTRGVYNIIIDPISIRYVSFARKVWVRIPIKSPPMAMGGL